MRCIPTRASASFSRTSSTWVPCRFCWKLRLESSSNCSPNSTKARRSCSIPTCAPCIWGATLRANTSMLHWASGSRDRTRWGSRCLSTATPRWHWVVFLAVPPWPPGTRSPRRLRLPKRFRNTVPSTAWTLPPDRTTTPSSRPKTKSPQSVWFWVPAGTGPALSPPRRVRGFRS